MNFVDYDNVSKGDYVKDINSCQIYRVISSIPDTEDTISGRRGENLTIENIKSKERRIIYSQQKISETLINLGKDYDSKTDIY